MHNTVYLLQWVIMILHNDQPPVSLIAQLEEECSGIIEISFKSQSVLHFLLLFYCTDASVDPIDLWTVNTKPEDSSRYATVCLGPSLPSISCIAGRTNHVWCLCRMCRTRCIAELVSFTFAANPTGQF